MNRSAPLDQPIELVVGPLRVCFEWQADRLAHRLSCRTLGCRTRESHLAEVASAGAFQTLLRSTEGDAGNRWPPHPPLQQIDIVQGAAGQVAQMLLVGMAGTAHWSLAVAADRQDARYIVFDAACRLREPAAWIGSSYELTSGVEVLQQTNNRVELRTDDLCCSVEPSGCTETGLDRCMVELVDVGHQIQRVVIRPTVLPERLPATVRWRYRIGPISSSEPEASNC